MLKSELIKRLQDIEWEDFEVKEARTDLPKSIWETVGAFSNTAGGWIVLGAKQSGKAFEITGLSHPEKIEQDFTTTLRGEKFNTKISCTAKKYRIDDKTVLLFYIPISERKPVYFTSPANTFIRTASGDQRATKEEINSMFRDQAFGTQTDKTIPGSDKSWLHKESLADYREFIRRNNPGHPYSKIKDNEFLQKVRILIDREVTYGGLFFLGKNDRIQSVITDFRIDYFEIPGTSYSDAKTRYSYRLAENENLWQYYFAILDRLLRQIDIPFKMGEQGASNADFPFVQALREALVNLIQHTDYFSPMRARIRVFYDRIEFFNPGALPLPLARIISSDISLPRNKIIAKLFRVANLCENGGYGFDKMNKGWNTYNATIPDYVSEIDFFKATFNTVKKGKMIPGIDLPEETGDRQGPETDQTGTRQGPEADQSVKIPVLTEWQMNVLRLINNNPSITRKDISSELNLNDSVTKKHIDALRKKGVIERVGGDFGGQWKILIEIDKMNSK